MEAKQTPARTTVTYLGGFGRSGSTLLERALGAVPGWVNVGELVDLPRSVYPDNELCGCGETFSDCPFWSAVGDRAFGGWSTSVISRLAELRLLVARQRHVPALLALRSSGRPSRLNDLVAEYQATYGQIYRAVAEVSGCTTVVDASKGPAHGLALGLDISTDRHYSMIMVNLVRDPRGVAYSWSRRRHERPMAGAGRRDMWSIGVGRSGAQWAVLQAEMELMSRVSGIRSTRVRYEDLVASPQPTLAALVDQISGGVPTVRLEHVGKHSINLPASHGLSGNPSRFKVGELDLVADVEWQRGLSRGERRLVTASTFPLLRRYGYPTTLPDPRG